MKFHIALTAAFAVVPCFAQPAEETSTPLDPIVVTATRSEQSSNRLPAAMTVITREAIERSGARHVVEVLRTAGALQITDLYGDGSRASVDLRGFGDSAHSTTLILVDGRRLNNPDIAPPDLNSIALKDVERIEIIQGSAGTLYGDQAVGGVINIITRTPQRFTAFADALAGSYDTRGVRAGLGQRWRAASLRLSTEARDSDNYRDHNALKYRNVLALVGYSTAAAEIAVEGGYVIEDLETPGPLFQEEVDQDRRQSTAAFRDDFSDTDTGFVRVNWRQRLGVSWALDTDISHRRSDGDFRLSFASGFSSPGSQDRELTSVNPRLTGDFVLFGRIALITAGIDALIADYQLNSAAFGEQTNDQRQRDFYAQAVLPLPADLELTVGGRAARVENRPRDAFTFTAPTRFHDTQSAGGLGLAWQLADVLRMFARYDRSFRFAKVDELTNACGAPNTVSLDTQTGDSYEAGIETTFGTARTRLSAYRLELDDEIAFDPTACFGFGANINLDSTRRDGVIAEVSLAIGQAVWLDASAHHIESRIAGGGLSGKEIPLVPRDSGKLGLSAQLPWGLLARVEGQAVDDRPLAGDFDNSLGRLPGFAVVNAGIAWSWMALQVDARINNVLDRRYSEYGAAGFDATFTKRESFFPSPERNVRLSVGYTW